METSLNNKSTVNSYRELWNFNLQKIEDIHQNIEKSFHDVENKYADFEAVYDAIIDQIELLSSIYSSYNAIKGGEYIMRLKAVLESYRKRYTREGLDFNLIQYLLIKITDMRDQSFELFPNLSHDGEDKTKRIGAASADDGMMKKYKWITFERNRSWFIAPFRDLVIRTDRNYKVKSFEEPDFIFISVRGTVLKIKDIFTKFPAWPVSPHYILLLNDRKKNFAADRIGRQIFTDTNIVMPLIRPFRKIDSNPLSPGRVRLFGINHILLY